MAVMGSAKRRALWYIMYCSAVWNLIELVGGGEEEDWDEGEGKGEGAVKGEGYHWDR